MSKPPASPSAAPAAPSDPFEPPPPQPAGTQWIEREAPRPETSSAETAKRT